eukprot:Rmarinus@m.16656
MILAELEALTPYFTNVPTTYTLCILIGILIAAFIYISRFAASVVIYLYIRYHGGQQCTFPRVSWIWIGIQVRDMELKYENYELAFASAKLRIRGRDLSIWTIDIDGCAIVARATDRNTSSPKPAAQKRGSKQPARCVTGLLYDIISKITIRCRSVVLAVTTTTSDKAKTTERITGLYHLRSILISNRSVNNSLFTTKIATGGMDGFIVCSGPSEPLSPTPRMMSSLGAFRRKMWINSQPRKRFNPFKKKLLERGNPQASEPEKVKIVKTCPLAFRGETCAACEEEDGPISPQLLPSLFSGGVRSSVLEIPPSFHCCPVQLTLWIKCDMDGTFPCLEVTLNLSSVTAEFTPEEVQAMRSMARQLQAHTDDAMDDTDDEVDADPEPELLGPAMSQSGSILGRNVPKVHVDIRSMRFGLRGSRIIRRIREVEDDDNDDDGGRSSPRPDAEERLAFVVQDLKVAGVTKHLSMEIVVESKCAVEASTQQASKQALAVDEIKLTCSVVESEPERSKKHFLSCTADLLVANVSMTANAHVLSTIVPLVRKSMHLFEHEPEEEIVRSVSQRFHSVRRLTRYDSDPSDAGSSVAVRQGTSSTSLLQEFAGKFSFTASFRNCSLSVFTASLLPESKSWDLYGHWDALDGSCSIVLDDEQHVRLGGSLKMHSLFLDANFANADGGAPNPEDLEKAQRITRGIVSIELTERERAIEDFRNTPFARVVWVDSLSIEMENVSVSSDRRVSDNPSSSSLRAERAGAWAAGSNTSDGPSTPRELEARCLLKASHITFLACTEALVFLVDLYQPFVEPPVDTDADLSESAAGALWRPAVKSPKRRVRSPPRSVAGSDGAPLDPPPRFHDRRRRFAGRKLTLQERLGKIEVDIGTCGMGWRLTDEVTMMLTTPAITTDNVFETLCMQSPRTLVNQYEVCSATSLVLRPPGSGPMPGAWCLRANNTVCSLAHEHLLGHQIDEALLAYGALKAYVDEQLFLNRAPSFDPSGPPVRVEVDGLEVRIVDHPMEKWLGYTQRLLLDELRQREEREELLARYYERRHAEMCICHEDPTTEECVYPSKYLHDMQQHLLCLNSEQFVKRHAALLAAVPNHGLLAKFTAKKLTLAFDVDDTLRTFDDIVAFMQNHDTDNDGPQENPLPSVAKAYSELMARFVEITFDDVQMTIRNYSAPLLAATRISLRGPVVLCEMHTDSSYTLSTVYKFANNKSVLVRKSLCSMKIYHNVLINLDEPAVAYGVAFEQALTDLSVASSRGLPGSLDPSAPLPWWDKLRYLIHGDVAVSCASMFVRVLGDEDPYNTNNYLEIYFESLALNFRKAVLIAMGKNTTVRQHPPPSDDSNLFTCPRLRCAVSFLWDCASGCPYAHHLHPLPDEVSHAGAAGPDRRRTLRVGLGARGPGGLGGCPCKKRDSWLRASSGSGSASVPSDSALRTSSRFSDASESSLLDPTDFDFGMEVVEPDYHAAPSQKSDSETVVHGRLWRGPVLHCSGHDTFRALRSTSLKCSVNITVSPTSKNSSRSVPMVTMYTRTGSWLSHLGNVFSIPSLPLALNLRKTGSNFSLPPSKPLGDYLENVKVAISASSPQFLLWNSGASLTSHALTFSAKTVDAQLLLTKCESSCDDGVGSAAGEENAWVVKGVVSTMCGFKIHLHTEEIHRRYCLVSGRRGGHDRGEFLASATKIVIRQRPDDAKTAELPVARMERRQGRSEMLLSFRSPRLPEDPSFESDVSVHSDYRDSGTESETPLSPATPSRRPRRLTVKTLFKRVHRQAAASSELSRGAQSQSRNNHTGSGNNLPVDLGISPALLSGSFPGSTDVSPPQAARSSSRINEEDAEYRYVVDNLKVLWTHDANRAWFHWQVIFFGTGEEQIVADAVSTGVREGRSRSSATNLATPDRPRTLDLLEAADRARERNEEVDSSPRAGTPLIPPRRRRASSVFLAESSMQSAANAPERTLSVIEFNRPQVNFRGESGSLVLSAASARSRSVVHTRLKVEDTLERCDRTVLIDAFQCFTYVNDVDVEHNLIWVNDPANTNSSDQYLLRRIINECPLEVFETTWIPATGPVISEDQLPPDRPRSDGRLERLSFKFSKVESTMVSSEFCIFTDVVQNLILARVESSSFLEEQVTSLLYKSQIDGDGGDADVYKIRTDLKACKEDIERIKKCLYNLSTVGGAATINARRERLESELSEKQFSRMAKMQALIQIARDRARGSKGRGQPAPISIVEYHVEEGHWRMKQHGSILAEMELRGLLGHVTYYDDGSSLNKHELRTFTLRDTMIEGPGFHSFVTSERALQENERMLTVTSKAQAAVGGIRVYDHFEVNLCPIKIQVVRRFFLSIQEYFFPALDKESSDSRHGELRDGEGDPHRDSTLVENEEDGNREKEKAVDEREREKEREKGRVSIDSRGGESTISDDSSLTSAAGLALHGVVGASDSVKSKKGSKALRAIHKIRKSIHIPEIRRSDRSVSPPPRGETGPVPRYSSVRHGSHSPPPTRSHKDKDRGSNSPPDPSPDKGTRSAPPDFHPSPRESPPPSNRRGSLLLSDVIGSPVSDSVTTGLTSSKTDPRIRRSHQSHHHRTHSDPADMGDYVAHRMSSVQIASTASLSSSRQLQPSVAHTSSSSTFAATHKENSSVSVHRDHAMSFATPAPLETTNSRLSIKPRSTRGPSITSLTGGSERGGASQWQDDVLHLMKSRGEVNMQFNWIRIGDVHVVATYRAERDKSSGFDMNNIGIDVPALQYSNRLWSWEEFYMQFRFVLIWDVLKKTTKNIVERKVQETFKRAGKRAHKVGQWIRKRAETRDSDGMTCDEDDPGTVGLLPGISERNDEEELSDEAKIRLLLGD